MDHHNLCMLDLYLKMKRLCEEEGLGYKPGTVVQWWYKHGKEVVTKLRASPISVDRWEICVY